MLLLRCPPGHNGLYLQTVSQDNPFPAHSAFIRYFVATVRKGPNTGRTANVTEGTVVGRCSHALLFLRCQWLLLHHVTKLNRFSQRLRLCKANAVYFWSSYSKCFPNPGEVFLKDWWHMCQWWQEVGSQALPAGVQTVKSNFQNYLTAPNKVRR